MLHRRLPFPRAHVAIMSNDRWRRFVRVWRHRVQKLVVCGDWNWVEWPNGTAGRASYGRFTGSTSRCNSRISKNSSFSFCFKLLLCHFFRWSNGFRIEGKTNRLLAQQNRWRRVRFITAQGALVVEGVGGVCGLHLKLVKQQKMVKTTLRDTAKTKRKINPTYQTKLSEMRRYIIKVTYNFSRKVWLRN